MVLHFFNEGLIFCLNGFLSIYQHGAKLGILVLGVGINFAQSPKKRTESWYVFLFMAILLLLYHDSRF